MKYEQMWDQLRSWLTDAQDEGFPYTVTQVLEKMAEVEEDWEASHTERLCSRCLKVRPRAECNAWGICIQCVTQIEERRARMPEYRGPEY